MSIITGDGGFPETCTDRKTFRRKKREAGEFAKATEAEAEAWSQPKLNYGWSWWNARLPEIRQEGLEDQIPFHGLSSEKTSGMGGRGGKFQRTLARKGGGQGTEDSRDVSRRSCV